MFRMQLISSAPNRKPIFRSHGSSTAISADVSDDAGPKCKNGSVLGDDVGVAGGCPRTEEECSYDQQRQLRSGNVSVAVWC